MVVYAPGHRGGIWNSFSKKKLKAVNPNCDVVDSFDGFESQGKCSKKMFSPKYERL